MKNKALTRKLPSSTAKRRPRRAAPAAPRPNRFHSFLKRLRSGGRSNMYGAIPYLMRTFELDRETAFRVVCEWVDQESAAGAEPRTPSPRR